MNPPEDGGGVKLPDPPSELPEDSGTDVLDPSDPPREGGGVNPGGGVKVGAICILLSECGINNHI